MINQYERLKMEQSAAGTKAILAQRRTSSHTRAPPHCTLCRRMGHTAPACHEYEVVKRGKNGGSGGMGAYGLCITVYRANLAWCSQSENYRFFFPQPCALIGRNCHECGERGERGNTRHLNFSCSRLSLLDLVGTRLTYWPSIPASLPRLF